MGVKGGILPGVQAQPSFRIGCTPARHRRGGPRRDAAHGSRRRRRSGQACTAALAQAEGKVVDFYELLNIDDDASTEQVKAAYRYLAKQCHPDFLGDEGHELCVLLNEAYSVLSDPRERQNYNARLQAQLQDDLDDYTGKALSKWLVHHPMGKAKDPAESRAVFVDESSCIGCKQCVWCASATFRIEPTHGRSRVFAQWIDDEDTMQDSIDACPVDCIHWVHRDDLPALEFVMQKRMGRTNVGVMMAGQGGAGSGDVFELTRRFLKERDARMKERAESRKYTPAQEAARSRAAESIRQQHSGWWGGFASAVNDAWAGVVDAAGGAGGSGGGSSTDAEVGQRRRARRTPLSDGRGTIPLERSLVPVRVQDPYRKF